MGNCRTNAGTATPSACDSGVTVPAWGVPERFEFESLTDPLTGVQKFSEWQLAASDILFRYEYNHYDEFNDGVGGPWYMRLDLQLATDDEGTDADTVASGKCAVPNDGTEKWYSAVVQMIVPAGTYYRTVVTQPLLTAEPQGPLPGGATVYQHNFATISAMENQS